ncbi:coiled-coil domain-containing protein 115 [Trichomycterus rosablanca]|uniref:coiled-coil domain-containing protein 115 n=1 Tax=Trichomycterus rosablanca TaxID=2290929 RepID=UPI002F359D8D
MGLDPAALRLDEQLLQFMDQLEILEEKREKLNSLIEEGWFNISKARYSMGNKHVSALQYASEMKPLVHVQASLSEEGEVEFQCERKDIIPEEPKESGAVETIGPTEGGLRRRVNIKQKDTEDENTSEEQSEKKILFNTQSENSTCQHQDPLKWFGILVPHNLRQAQAAFKQVINLSAEISTLQSAILKTRKEMQHEVKEKQKISSKLKE